MTDRSANFVGTIPQSYDRELGPVIFSDSALDIATRAAASGAARVLEIAAGTGIATRQLRTLLPATSRLTATDLNPPMLEVARAKFRPNEQVDFQPADATALPFPDGSFDAVVCQFGVMYFPDKDKAYREVHRVLSPGGYYIFSAWDSPAHNPFGLIAHEILGSFMPDDPPQFYRVPFGYCLLDPIKASLEAAGFTGIEISIRAMQKEIGDVDAFARGAVFGNPSIDQIKARGDVDAEKVVDAMAAALRREFADGRMPLQTIVIEARA